MLVILSLGANLGQREETLKEAILLLSEKVGPLIKRSSFYYSKPWGFVSQHEFCNLCASFETTLTPTELLKITQDIEKQLGRTSKTTQNHSCRIIEQSNDQNLKNKPRKENCQAVPVYHDRPIDIDILLYDNQHIQTEELTIPHPKMNEREFVMIPLREILEETLT